MRVGRLGIGAAFKLPKGKTIYIVIHVGQEGLGGFSVDCLNTRTKALIELFEDVEVEVLDKWIAVEL
jgi:hypothetical protein